MAYTSAKDTAHVFVGGYNIAAALESIRMKQSAVLDERKFLGNVYPTNIDTGIRTGELEAAGVLTSTTTDEVNAVNGTGREVSVLSEGNTVSARFWGFSDAIVSGVEVGIAPDTVDTLTPSFTVTGRVDYGTIVGIYAARTTADDTDAAYADLGEGKEITTGRVYLHCDTLTLGGYTNLVVKLRDSDDHVTFADHTTMTALTDVGSESKALDGATERYLSISWAWTGAGADQTASFFVGVGSD